ncbi:hypothetical protein B0H17DRAFT_1127707 [Mycena rosella]|uniref:Zn(2)-C6 fungal-type domain-containing protein n=1 Tax=Mycena rosella TaxID=1033263 RepID=A0AAD7GRB9_MYCRO|nr:hypothetical protein B0H17DRAFT_1127707 [Mycena rosella]
MPESATPTDTRTSKKHRRVYVACLACRRRKIKCVTASEAESTPCARCTREGIPCEYAAVQHHDGGSSTPSPDAQGRSPASDWGTELQPGGTVGYATHSSTHRPGLVPPPYPQLPYRLPNARHAPGTSENFYPPPLPLHMHSHGPPQFYSGPNQQPLSYPSGSYSDGGGSFYDSNQMPVYEPHIYTHDTGYRFQPTPTNQLSDVDGMSANSFRSCQTNPNADRHLNHKNTKPRITVCSRQPIGSIQPICAGAAAQTGGSGAPKSLDFGTEDISQGGH